MYSLTPRFTQLHSDGNARSGTFRTIHGAFETPQFMPVGTRGTVKGVDVERLQQMRAQVILVNTYHLWLRPGEAIVQQLGGIHAFCGWHKPILSDSGGFQVFSLQNTRKVSEEGVEFRSHLDGSLHLLTPEKSIQIQETLGVDIAMALDECPAGHLDSASMERSLDLTLRWAKRSLEARRDPRTALFGITQGGSLPALRARSAQTINELPFDGAAIGGLSVGESKETMYEVLSYHVQQLSEQKIRYLMGVGTPQDLVQAVHEGVDLFDCVMPTRAGRFGRAFISGEVPVLNIRNAKFATQEESIDPTCQCVACRNYSRGYVNHLFKVGEMLGPQLLSIHNLEFFLNLMNRMREAIKHGTFNALYTQEMKRWNTAIHLGESEEEVRSYAR